ncbi:glycosyltransferase [Breoghania sp.]|uniref:glycosyltransferase n=1 Tax=Breoghania sp. TaxID=2065378 RepID=UPI002AAB1EED|nr:glycosyltransferase [Breoghania sp.]
MSVWSEPGGFGEGELAGFSDAGQAFFHHEGEVLQSSKVRDDEDAVAALLREAVLPPDIGFLVGRGIATEVLYQAKTIADECGGYAADILIERGFVTSEGYYRALADELGVPFLKLKDLKPEPNLVLKFTRSDLPGLAVLALESRGEGMEFAMAPRPASIAEVLRRAKSDVRVRARLSIASPDSLRRAVAIHGAVRGLEAARPEYSAARLRGRSGPAGTLRAAMLVLMLAALVVFAPRVLMGLAAALFIIGSAARFCAGLHEGREHPLRRGKTPGEADWPPYTVLVPLYREAAVVADLIAALQRLDYPPDLLDIKLLVEEDDRETREALTRHLPGPSFQVVVVPPGGPRTKPKALSYAMRFARGELVTVFDAEDRPDPDQLRKCARLFASGPPSLGGVQARLAVDHAQETFFTRQFALEYATLFDILLPWMSNHRLLLPLGGTSNHFRRRALDDCGGWDPHNVTEDIDIGIRLVRDGWQMVTVASTTWEEAPLTFSAWLNQRVRWHKGWLQTWLVHMRRPGQLWRDLGPTNFLVTVLLFAGTATALIAHPLFIGLVALYAIDHKLMPQLGGLADLTMMGAGAISLVAGYGAAVFAMQRAARLRRLHVRLGDWLALPVYWLLMSLAFAIAVVELVWRPDHWRKTRHGVARGRLKHGLRRPRE